jgi:hypothetical protein
MKKSDRTQKAPHLNPAALDALIEEIATDAYGEEEQLWAFRQAFEDNIVVPCNGFLMGERVSVIEFDYDGNERRGLTAKCRRADGRVYEVAACEVVITPGTEGARYLAAYRKWMGLPPRAAEVKTPARDKASPQSHALQIDGTVELAVLSVERKAARCRLLDSVQIVTLRASRLGKVVPGEIAVVKPGKQWKYGGQLNLAGTIESTRLDAAALGLVPLKIEDRGPWNPSEHYWGEEGEPIAKWAKPIIAWGQRRVFEMEQVLPGADSSDPFSDPIGESNDRKESGDFDGARQILVDICRADLRCLDAHAHLGNLVFDGRARQAIRHYEAGFRIGELSLGEGFDGLLPWGWIDNRPFLRCMHGFGLCLWRLGRFKEAARIFDRMLWLNPSDNQGVRFLINEVRAGVRWKNSVNR